ncbi:MAG: hypothetical protein E4H20_04965 [Spirochaetales bacterium]|nr:MAG: hypothetical protein E4H20_04965 [Spirochaetales bacterium]
MLHGSRPVVFIMLASVLIASGCKSPVEEPDFPPDISITSPVNGAYASGALTVSGTASDDIGVTLVEFSTDNGATFMPATGKTAWSAVIDTTGFSDGGFPVMVRATDKVGGMAYDFVTVIVDNTGPTVSIINPSAGQAVSGFLPLIGLGNKVDDVWYKIDLAAYELAAGTFVWNAVIDTTQLLEGPHTITVYGSRDNPSALSPDTTVSFTVDQTIPSVAIDLPASGSYLKGNVSFSGTATDDNGVSGVDISFNGGSVWTNTVGTLSWNLAYDTTAVPDGARTVIVRAKDITGLSGTTSIPVVIDNNDPTVSITTPVTGITANSVIHFIGTASDGVGVEKVELQFGTSSSFVTVNGTTSWNLDVDPALYDNGSYAVTVRATDFAANSAQNSINVKVDKNLPVLSGIGGIVASQHYKGIIAISGSSSDADVGDTITDIQVKAGAGAFVTASGFTPGNAAWTHDLDTAGFPNGATAVTLRVTDNWGGNTDTVFNVTFDNAAPSVAISQPDTGIQVSGNILVTGSVFDAISINTLVLRIKDANDVGWPVDANIKPSVSGGLWSYLWDTAAFDADIDITIEVAVSDLAGNAVTDTVTVQRTVNTPSVSIISPANGVYKAGTVTVTGTASTPAGTITAVDVRIDDGSWIPVTTVDGWANWSVDLDSTPAGLNLADGLRTLQARVTTDYPSSNSSGIQINIDNTPPATGIDAPTNAYTGANALHGTVSVERDTRRT